MRARASTASGSPGASSSSAWTTRSSAGPGSSPRPPTPASAPYKRFPCACATQTIGALNLFYRAEQPLLSSDAHVAQALADVATIGILQQRSIDRSEQLAQQLQAALDTRTVIEQAKGVLAERGSLSMDVAFEVLRRYCRSQRLHLADTARGIVDGSLDTGRLLG